MPILPKKSQYCRVSQNGNFFMNEAGSKSKRQVTLHYPHALLNSPDKMSKKIPNKLKAKTPNYMT